MFKKTLSCLVLPLVLLISGSPLNSVAQNPDKPTGLLEKMAVISGNVAMDLDLNRLNGNAAKESKLETLRFEIAHNSFFPVVVFNNELRGPDLGSMGLVSSSTPKLPRALAASFGQLCIEKTEWSEQYGLVVRDAKSGFVFFNIEGHVYDYDSTDHSFKIANGRLLISSEFANKLGRPSDAGSSIGKISASALVTPLEITNVVNGAVQSATLPATHPGTDWTGQTAGPDVIVGDLPSLSQFGSSGTQVGLAVGTTSCNNGSAEFNWFALPNNDHPVIPQNLYRMSGGTGNADRFEQVGQSWLKHAFTALQNNACSFGCTSAANGTHLGVGCSDPYDASLNAGQSGLGSRAWVNPFTGFYPSGGSNPNYTARNHSGHTETGVSHRIAVETSDLAPASNPGAAYFAEAQYVTPHEYAWCNSTSPPHHGECNMYNNASYRRFNVSVSGSTFNFASSGATVRMTPAIYAWTGATVNTIEPDPGNDGIFYVGYKVTNPSAGVWHYEYAIYNQNLDRAIQSFSVPLACGNSLTNLGFHAPQNPPAAANDGTVGSAGYSNTAWSPNQTATDVTWNSQTFAQNQNANAIRWGTLYNFRFDSNSAPQSANATIGFLKTGAPINVAIQAPSAICSPLQLTGLVSQKLQGGKGPFSIPLPVSGTPGVECRSGGATGDYTLIFAFSNNLNGGNAGVTGGTASLVGSPTVSGNKMTVNLTGVTNSQTVTLNLSGVTDTFSQTLANTPVAVEFLYCDVTGNGQINSSDVSQVQAESGHEVTDANCAADVTGNGEINSSDVSSVQAMSGTGRPNGRAK